MGLIKKIFGKTETSTGWTGRSQSPRRRARVEREDGYQRQIVCNNGKCPDVSFVVPKTTTRGRCPGCGTRWHV